MAFWGRSGRLYIIILSSVLILALFAEWNSVYSSHTAVHVKTSRGKMGWNDSRQLRMDVNGQQSSVTEGSTVVAAAAAAATDGGSSSSSKPQRRGVTFQQAFPELGSSPDVQHFKPTIYGHMQKQGHLAWDHWSTKRMETRVDNFLSWRLNRTVNGPPTPTKEGYTCKAADHPALPYPGCHIFINHKYKYIYIRSPKAASTSIVDELGECNNVRTRGYNNSLTCMGMHSSWEHFYKDSKNITDMWRDYFVFGFVRNPWKRAYSLFKYMQSDGCMPGDNLANPKCQMDWANFCTDPWGSSDRVSDLGCLSRSKSYMYFHMMDQHHCMITDKGEWAVDFIGRVEQANEDWAEVVKTINTRRDADMPELPYNDLVPQNVRNGSVSDPYGGENAHCLDAVSSWYACDIEKFGYLKGQPSAKRQ